MLLQGLYRLDKSHIGRLSALMSESFMEDPLFLRLVPNEAVRKKLLPHYFAAYFNNFFDYCHAWADSAAINGAVVVFDETDHFCGPRYLLCGLRAGLQTALHVVGDDHTLKTAFAFLRGLKYLKSAWVSRMVHAPDLHIDFLAVRREARGQGVAGKLVSAVLSYADSRGITATLETHNQRNVPLYNHFGFKTVLELTGFGLRQYCMVR